MKLCIKGFFVLCRVSCISVICCACMHVRCTGLYNACTYIFLLYMYIFFEFLARLFFKREEVLSPPARRRRLRRLRLRPVKF